MMWSDKKLKVNSSENIDLRMKLSRRICRTVLQVYLRKVVMFLAFCYLILKKLNSIPTTQPPSGDWSTSWLHSLLLHRQEKHCCRQICKPLKFETYRRNSSDFFRAMQKRNIAFFLVPGWNFGKSKEN